MVKQDLKEQAMDINDIAEKVKKEKGLKKVFITSISDIDIIWRRIKRSEYRDIMAVEYKDEDEETTFMRRQDLTAKSVILYPNNVDELLEEYAGVADVIATKAMIEAGFGNTDTRTV